ncbi:unnamed protein product [Tetraodon nigroviridis]|uniref:(spotted green pufferfish) hypothetical protein n=1 Tax=Tetraodon nigroviridis TaxID=99883 RepID=Q4T3U4_TETNG|nr:unnamed protein product [Tetraodon nigroviridis]
MACSGGQSNAEPLEGFHEVNLASPTTPDLQNQAEQRPSARHCTPPTSLYRTHSLGGRTSLCAGQLPTQPVYSTPRPSHNGRYGMSRGPFQARRREPAEGTLLPGEDGEECSALSDGLSRLRSPSVMEVREKGYERLKEELAKAQRVHTRTHTHTHTCHMHHTHRSDLKQSICGWILCASVCVCVSPNALCVCASVVHSAHHIF